MEGVECRLFGGGLRLQMDNLHALAAADASAILPALAAGMCVCVREREREREYVCV